MLQPSSSPPNPSWLDPSSPDTASKPACSTYSLGGRRCLLGRRRSIRHLAQRLAEESASRCTRLQGEEDRGFTPFQTMGNGPPCCCPRGHCLHATVVAVR
jgi:hypothetical protein